MSIQFNKRYLLTSVALVAVAIAGGCGDEDTVPQDSAASIPAATPTPPMATYNAPGSNWEFGLHEDGSYEVSRSAMPGMDSDLDVGGTYQVTSQGFVSMTVDTANGVDAPATGTSIWGLEIPDYALLLSPVSTDSDSFIPMVSGSSCPGTDLSNNWINVRAGVSSDATSPESGYFGSLTYKYADGATELSSQYALTSGNPDQGVASLGTGYCQDGVVRSPSSDIYLSTSGSAVVHAGASGADGGWFVFALPMTTASSITALDGSYAGMYSDDGAGTGEKVAPVVVTCVSGICTGDFVTDIDAGTVAGTPFTVDLSGSFNVPSGGLTTGQLNVDGSAGNLGCMVDENLGGANRRVISCAGQSPMSGYRLFNLVLTSND